MLKALRIEEARAIAAAALRRSRDERAMVDYLGIGRRGDAAIAARVILSTNIDLAAFESDERRALFDLIETLSEAAKRELIALIGMAQRPSLNSDAALRRTRRIPIRAQTGYLMGVRLERTSSWHSSA
jgi:hypothetical protein